jgi:hypothetical protein
MAATIAAIIFASLAGVVILFQCGLALGLPWGAASMGGKYPGKYPPAMRAVALLNMLVLAGIAIIVLVKADFIFPGLYAFASIAIWFVVGFNAIGTLLNSITPSKIEQRLWAPTTALMLATSIIVALG